MKSHTTHVPRVSVIMPVYNGSAFVRRAVTSILEQTYDDFELVVIDDQSTDHSRDILAEFADHPRVRLEHNEVNLGIAETMNRGLKLARGTYVARHDQDDISLPNRLALQVTYLNQHSNVAAVGSQLELVNEAEQHITTWKYPTTATTARWQGFFNIPLTNPAALFSKEIVLKAGGFSNSFEPADDYDLWARVLDMADVSSLPETLVLYRIHPKAVTNLQFDKMSNARREISSRLLTRHVSNDDATTIVDACLNSGLSVDQVCDTIAPCGRLYRSFLETHSPTDNDIKQIRNSLIAQIIDQSSACSFVDRLRIYKKLRTHIPLAGRERVKAAKVLLPDTTKEFLKKLMGMRSTTEVHRGLQP